MEMKSKCRKTEFLRLGGDNTGSNPVPENSG